MKLLIVLLAMMAVNVMFVAGRNLGCTCECPQATSYDILALDAHARRQVSIPVRQQQYSTRQNTYNGYNNYGQQRRPTYSYQ